MDLSRRQIIKLFAGSGLALYLQPCEPKRSWAITAPNLSAISPIDRSLPDIANPQFFSDDPDRAHSILWNKPGFVQRSGHLPPPSENVPLVIIGGGVAGLFSAYLLRKHQPIVLELASRFGGNSKGQSWRGVDYSIGAAYFVEPEAETDLANLCSELGIDKLWKIKQSEDPVEIENKILKEFWSGESLGNDKQARAQFEKLNKYFSAVNEGETIAYPEIPVIDPKQLSYIKDLDQISFKKHLETIAGGPLHPHIEAAFEHYCWSSLGASSVEISAAAGLNFYAAEFGNIAICPGGNSAVLERLLEKLLVDLPADRLRASCLAYDVRPSRDSNGDGVNVTYQNAAGSIITIHAKAVIMSCPKFVVGKILEGIEPRRLQAIQKLKYRSYLVANVCLKTPFPDPFYDIYLLGDGRVNTDSVKDSAIEQGVTDVIVANYARGEAGDNTVLTLYRAFPFDGARADLFLPTAYQNYRESFEQQINSQILPLLGLNKDHVVDLRIARWGHPIPLAAVNLIAEGTIDELRKPFGKRVFFVEQDNWALPAFETSVTEAFTCAPQVDQLISAAAPAKTT